MNPTINVFGVNNHVNPCETNKHIINKLIAAILIILCTFIYFASYDMPASLMEIIEDLFRVKAYQFEYLYTFYSLPAVSVCIFSGVLFDKYVGLYKGSLLVVFVALVGQILITIGGFTSTFGLMILGRFFYGIGTESLVVSLNCFLFKWFKGKEVSFMFGLFQFSVRLGSAGSFLTSVPLYKLIKRLGVPENYVFGLTITPFLVLVGLQVFIVMYLCYFTRKNECYTYKSDLNHINFKLKHVLTLPIKVWLITAAVVVSTANVFALISVSQKFFKMKYGLSLIAADNLSMYFNVFTAVSAPIIGFIIDRIDKKLTLSIISVVFGIVSQIFMFVPSVSAYAPLTLFSLNTNFIILITLPMIGEYVQDYQLGCAYGVLGSSTNAFTALFQLIVGYLIEKEGPDSVICFILPCLILSLIILIILVIVDKF